MISKSFTDKAEIIFNGLFLKGYFNLMPYEVIEISQQSEKWDRWNLLYQTLKILGQEYPVKEAKKILKLK